MQLLSGDTILNHLTFKWWVYLLLLYTVDQLMIMFNFCFYYLSHADNKPDWLQEGQRWKSVTTKTGLDWTGVGWGGETLMGDLH